MINTKYEDLDMLLEELTKDDLKEIIEIIKCRLKEVKK